ncbi:hypothetical protein [Halalkalibacter urbisdiaboli]|uniref:hypothetical protein n=1 Tax=Halalkalibacter urbisdiaboli TaxID=1960589 RepID=UPI000B42E274|nr:hypothetical protein [Halalkalibacter urbisdiaboli]
MEGNSLQQALDTLLGLTRDLLSHLTLSLPSNIEDRESYINEVERLLTLREEAIQSINRPAETEDERTIASEILTLNQQVESKLKSDSILLKRDIDQMNYKKKVNKRYDNPYDAPMNEGAFIDKRGI